MDRVLHDRVQDTKPVWGAWFAGSRRLRAFGKYETAEQSCCRKQAE